MIISGNMAAENKNTILRARSAHPVRMMNIGGAPELLPPAQSGFSNRFETLVVWVGGDDATDRHGYICIYIYIYIYICIYLCIYTA